MEILLGIIAVLGGWLFFTIRAKNKAQVKAETAKRDILDETLKSEYEWFDKEIAKLENGIKRSREERERIKNMTPKELSDYLNRSNK